MTIIKCCSKLKTFFHNVTLPTPFISFYQIIISTFHITIISCMYIACLKNWQINSLTHGLPKIGSNTSILKYSLFPITPHIKVRYLVVLDKSQSNILNMCVWFFLTNSLFHVVNNYFLYCHQMMLKNLSPFNVVTKLSNVS